MKVRMTFETPPDPKYYPMVIRSNPPVMHTYEMALAAYEDRKARGALLSQLHMEATHPRDEGGMQSGGLKAGEV